MLWKTTLALLALAIDANTLTETIALDGDLSTLSAVLEDANYADIKTAVNAGDVTLFAPTNQAFADAKIDIAYVTNATNVAAVKSILQYHALGSKVNSTDLLAIQFPATLQTDTVRVTVNMTKTGADVKANLASVTTADVAVTTGDSIVHVINGVLTPPVTTSQVAMQQSNLQTLSTVLELSEYSAVKTAVDGGAVTVFAPTDQAFADAMIDTAFVTNATNVATVTSILQYHALGSKVASTDLAALQFPATLQGPAVKVAKSTSAVTVNELQATVITADVSVNSDAGVVHVINGVLSLPGTASQVLTADGTVSDLVTALVENNLVSTVEGLTAATVFAPRNVDGLASYSGDDLTNALLLHVVPSTAYSTDLPTLEAVEAGTMSACTATRCPNLKFTQEGANWLVNGKTIVTTDLLTANGVIHIIEEAMVLDQLDGASQISATLALSAVAFALLV